MRLFVALLLLTLRAPDLWASPECTINGVNRVDLGTSSLSCPANPVAWDNSVSGTRESRIRTRMTGIWCDIACKASFSYHAATGGTGDDTDGDGIADADDNPLYGECADVPGTEVALTETSCGSQSSTREYTVTKYYRCGSTPDPCLDAQGFCDGKKDDLCAADAKAEPPPVLQVSRCCGQEFESSPSPVP